MHSSSDTAFPFDEYTNSIYSTVCSGEPVCAESAEDVIGGIQRAIALDVRPVFREGLAARLTQLGTVCTAADTETLCAAVRERYQRILRKPCPRTVLEWCRGTTPGTANRRNHYDLCYALEMNEQETALFFQKVFFTLPFLVKAKTDAVFLYCLHHQKPYSAVKDLLRHSDGFVPQENAHTATVEIKAEICKIHDDAQFLQYLSAHCYDNPQQFQAARSIIRHEIEIIQSTILKYEPETVHKPDKLTSRTVEKLLGYKYQHSDLRGGTVAKSKALPRRFTESLPVDATLGAILRGGRASYELLRKTLMLLKFSNFYEEADNYNPQSIHKNLGDFCTELNAALADCGFAHLYVCHPFDCLLLYCANSDDPIDTLYCVIQNGRNPDL